MRPPRVQFSLAESEIIILSRGFRWQQLECGRKNLKTMFWSCTSCFLWQQGINWLPEVDLSKLFPSSLTINIFSLSSLCAALFAFLSRLSILSLYPAGYFFFTLPLFSISPFSLSSLCQSLSYPFLLSLFRPSLSSLSFSPPSNSVSCVERLSTSGVQTHMRRYSGETISFLQNWPKQCLLRGGLA